MALWLIYLLGIEQLFIERQRLSKETYGNGIYDEDVKEDADKGDKADVDMVDRVAVNDKHDKENEDKENRKRKADNKVVKLPLCSYDLTFLTFAGPTMIRQAHLDYHQGWKIKHFPRKFWLTTNSHK